VPDLVECQNRDRKVGSSDDKTWATFVETSAEFTEDEGGRNNVKVNVPPVQGKRRETRPGGAYGKREFTTKPKRKKTVIGSKGWKGECGRKEIGIAGKPGWVTTGSYWRMLHGQICGCGQKRYNN